MLNSFDELKTKIWEKARDMFKGKSIRFDSSTNSEQKQTAKKNEIEMACQGHHICIYPRCFCVPKNRVYSVTKCKDENNCPFPHCKC